MNTHFPSWLDLTEYPFTCHYLPLSMGKMHYVDEGKGETILMLHGNPTWSYLYRNAIKGLSKQYRCIAPDYIGFGLSDKPRDWSYRPQEQAQNVERLIAELKLKDITLVVQDWGGPIGLSYALQHPENVKRLLIMNTWMWSVKGQISYEFFGRLTGGRVGQHLVNRYNFFARTMIKFVFADKSALDPGTHEQYIAPLPNPEG
jgi:haloalkane dehalogenase